MRSLRRALTGKTFLACACVVAVSVLVYSRSLGNDFVIWDDDNLVFDNPIVVSVTPASVWKAFTSYDPELYVPLTIVSYQLERLAFGFEPFFYHLNNLVLHAAVSVLALLLLVRLGLRREIAFVAALVFAVHPLNTETVAWVSARKDLLCALFSFASLLAWLRGAWRWSIGFLLLALLGKATAVVVPLLILLIEWKEGRLSRTAFAKTLPHWLLAILFVGIALLGKTRNISEVTLLETLLLAFKSFAFSLKQYAWPSGLSILYLQNADVDFADPWIPLSILFAVVTLAVVLLSLRKTKVLAFGVAFYALCLLPSFANFSKAGTVYFFSDRYVYMGQLGLLFVAGVALEKTLRNLAAAKRHAAIAMPGALLVLLLGSFAYGRSLVWASSESLYRNALERDGRSKTMHYNLGILEYRRGNLKEAEEHYVTALQIDPEYGEAWVNMGILRRDQGRPDEAIAHFEHAIETDPHLPEPRNNIGSILAERGDVDGAIARYREAIAADPMFAQARINLADAYGKKGMYAEGLEEYRKAFSIDPRLREIYPDAAKLLESL